MSFLRKFAFYIYEVNKYHFFRIILSKSKILERDNVIFFCLWRGKFQASRSSQLFDIALPGESDGNVRYHANIAPAVSIKPTSITLPGLVESQTHPCELYSPNWVVFQPNIIIDAKMGCLWHIKLCLLKLCYQIRDLSLCTQVALKRTDGTPVILKLLLDAVANEKPPLEKIRESLNHINFVYREWVEAELQTQSASTPNAQFSSIKSDVFPRVLIDQNTILEEIFQKMDIEKDLRKTELILVIYLSSLTEYGIPAQESLNKRLVTTLVGQKKFTTLQQLLQYGVITDTKKMAVFLLSLGNLHSSSIQMALDMFARLDAKDEIQEVLLSEGEVLSALKLAQKDANPRKFLTTAKNLEHPTLLHSVLYYFRNNPHFAAVFKKDDRLVSFINEYNVIFSDTN